VTTLPFKLKVVDLHFWLVIHVNSEDVGNTESFIIIFIVFVAITCHLFFN